MARLLLFGLMFLFSGCATVVSGTTQTVFVDTPKVNGASCKLNDSKAGVWYLPSTPGSATVRKGDGPMNIVCDKTGYNTATVSVDETLVGATLGNIILGGGIGIFIDAASGAAQQYPDKIVVWMRPRKWSTAKEEEAWHRDKKAYEDEILAKAKAASGG